MTEEEIELLRQSHKSGWDQTQVPSLFITYNEGTDHYVLRDWSGYLCQTQSLLTLATLIQFEATSSGSVRELLSGNSRHALNEAYQRKREALLNPSPIATSKRPSAGSTLIDLDLSDLIL